MTKFVQNKTKPFNVSNELFEWIRSVRRFLHRHPELGFKEEKGARYIQDRLTELKIPFKTGVAGSGIIATLGETGNCTKHVALRADMDALPIQEKTGLSFASINAGVMHACAHDGHVAMLLGAAALLQSIEIAGRVDLLFQPAEETGKGAKRMVQDGCLNGVQAVFAGHIDTHFETGQITVDEGVICAWADPFSINIRGRSGHAARPHEAADAVVASASLISALQTLVSRETNPNSSAVVTVGRLIAGVAPNVIAEEALLEGTLRCTDERSREHAIAGIRRIAGGIGIMHGVEIEVSFNDSLPAVINDSVATAVAKEAAFFVVGGEGVISQGAPSLGGEDFSFYQKMVNGCLVRFGAALERSVGPAHSSTFDFDEDVLPLGACWLASAASRWLAR